MTFQLTVMAYSFRPRTGTAQSGAARTPLVEIMQTGSEVTASKAIKILEDDASRVADSGSKGTDSAKYLSEDAQLSQEMVSADHLQEAPNATATTLIHSSGLGPKTGPGIFQLGHAAHSDYMNNCAAIN